MTVAPLIGSARLAGDFSFNGLSVHLAVEDRFDVGNDLLEIFSAKSPEIWMFAQ